MNRIKKTLVSILALALLAGPASRGAVDETSAPKPEGGNYPNNREPLLKTKYVKLPLGAIEPTGWLRDQLKVQANGMTGHLHEVWNLAKTTAWKGDVGVNVTPEPCFARFVPRWLEGLVPLAYMLDDPQLKALADRYLKYLVTVEDPATVTPSVCGWSHLGRVLPDYYEATGDARAIKLARRILDYADSVRTSKKANVILRPRLGMLLSFAWWYYNRTGDRDIPDLVERCTKPCVENFAKYYVHFPETPKQQHRHGVDVCQGIQYPVLYYLKSKNEADKNSVLQGIVNLDKHYGQVGGRWNADEFLEDLDPTHGTELCDLTELVYCLQKDFEALGELSFADRMEQIVFNGVPGTCTADWWAHQYDQQANQVLVSVAKRPWRADDETSNVFGFTPNYPCCLSNMHSAFPRYVQSMWMATEDRGLVAALYGPCRLKAKVADGLPVEISEETDYPFSDQVRFTIHSAKPASFPIYFRIPSWAEGAELTVSDDAKPVRPQQGTFVKIVRMWKSGDVVTLALHHKVRTETRKNNAVSIAWGPLYFVLRIGESFKDIPVVDSTNDKVATPPGCVNWRIDPTTAWNYALAIDRKNPRCEMVANKISSMPFARKGEPVKLPGTTAFVPWQEDVPLVLTMKARTVPQWGMNGANAGDVPVSPVRTTSAETTVELIPYGCTRLRISEFPTVD